jgi:hypothetical protein
MTMVKQSQFTPTNMPGETFDFTVPIRFNIR